MADIGFYKETPAAEAGYFYQYVPQHLLDAGDIETAVSFQILFGAFEFFHAALERAWQFGQGFIFKTEFEIRR